MFMQILILLGFISTIRMYDLFKSKFINIIRMYDMFKSKFMTFSNQLLPRIHNTKPNYVVYIILYNICH